MIFVSSWDDGHPNDHKLVDLYIKRGLHTTLYVPLINPECMQVLSDASIREIHNLGIEIGSHTKNHTYLKNLPELAVIEEIIDGKLGLEDIIGDKVNGFCYPGGYVPKNYRVLLECAGISYARTIENLRVDADYENFLLPTTLQFYPHTRLVLLKNIAKYMCKLKNKFSILSKYNSSENLVRFIADFITMNRDSDYVFHLWGHSWEIDKFDQWAGLEYLLDVLVDNAIPCLTVEQYHSSIFSKKRFYGL